MKYKVKNKYIKYCQKAEKLGLKPRKYQAYYMFLKRGHSEDDLYKVREKKVIDKQEYQRQRYQRQKIKEFQKLKETLEALRKDNDGKIKTVQKGMKHIKTILS